jgi:hypothetical protein
MPVDVTLDAQIACVKREIAMRLRVYPKFIISGKMKSTEADHQIAAMQAVLATLVGLSPTP